jgi:hypothetical protein
MTKCTFVPDLQKTLDNQEHIIQGLRSAVKQEQEETAKVRVIIMILLIEVINI